MEDVKITKEETPKFILTYEDFQFIEKNLLGIGYQKIYQHDSRKTFLRLNLSPPRRIVGREASYWYSHNGYTVILHTSFLEKEKKWREKGTDIGWNLISEGDEARYFARPFQRKKGFVLKFLRYAWISKWKVDHRPLCPKCQAYMYIQRKKNTRSYYWSCDHNDLHPDGKPVFLSWDYGLPPKATMFIGIRRENTKRYNEKNKKEGKKITPAAVKRKKWIIGKPENLT